MKTSNVTAEDFSESVLAVPPVALTDKFRINESENRRLIDHIERGGVRTLLYGGNANLHNYPIDLFSDLLVLLGEAASEDSWVIPSIGPTYGKMIDEARVLCRHAFPCAMVLPLTFPKTASGIEQGLRAVVQVLGKPVIVYIKEADYLPPERLAQLLDSGDVCGIKYAVPRPDFSDDPYLAAILELYDRRKIVSGFGELPAVPHLSTYGLAGFTAGAVCIAPRRSMAILAALKAMDAAAVETLLAPIRAFEGLREAHSPIRVLHEAVTLANIADMGPMLPMLSNLEPTYHPAVRSAAAILLHGEQSLHGSKAA